MAAISLRAVEKIYPNGHSAVAALNLEIADGEFLVLVGPSGSGKSTALRLIAGLETPTAGSIHIDERDVTTVPPQERDLAMVFQSYALYPHRTVHDNLAFPLRMQRAAADTIAERVRQVAETLGLTAVLDRKPAQLSGGQRQRVALGRALVRQPRAFLLDEPLSNLDPALRVQTRAELARLHRRIGATFVYVTHDQQEAMTLGDRIGVMRAGVLQQVAAPLELYRRPASVFVATFIGSPAMNLVRSKLSRAQGRSMLEGPGFRLALAADLPGQDDVLLGFRPHDVELLPPEHANADWTGTIELIEPLGSEQHLHLRMTDADLRVVVAVPPETRRAIGQRVGLGFLPEHLHVFDAATEQRLA